VKAKEYAKKYIPIIKSMLKTSTNSDDIWEYCKTMYLDYANEAMEICKLRNIKFDSAFKSVIIEQNKKWNAMVRIFEEANLPFIKRDAFINVAQEIINKQRG
jgi:hypothetical protein